MKRFIALLFFALPACAVTPESTETLFEIGPSQVGDKFTGGAEISVTERFNDRYDLTLGIVTKQTYKSCPRPDCVWEEEQQIYFGAELLLNPLWFWTDRVKFGFGPYLAARPDRFVSSFLQVGLSLELRLTDWLGIRARHRSVASAGIREIKFCNRDDSFCDTRSFNNGHDSWYRLQFRKKFY